MGKWVLFGFMAVVIGTFVVISRMRDSAMERLEEAGQKGLAWADPAVRVAYQYAMRGSEGMSYAGSGAFYGGNVNGKFVLLDLDDRGITWTTKTEGARTTLRVTCRKCNFDALCPDTTSVLAVVRPYFTLSVPSPIPIEGRLVYSTKAAGRSYESAVRVEGTYNEEDNSIQMRLPCGPTHRNQAYDVTMRPLGDTELEIIYDRVPLEDQR